ncbi:MAG: hypothetical protein ACLRZZ_02445 [Enterocloster sp.]
MPEAIRIPLAVSPAWMPEAQTPVTIVEMPAAEARIPVTAEAGIPAAVGTLDSGSGDTGDSGDADSGSGDTGGDGDTDNGSGDTGSGGRQ